MWQIDPTAVAQDSRVIIILKTWCVLLLWTECRARINMENKELVEFSDGKTYNRG